MLLVNGGRDSIHIQLDSTEIYDPDIGSWRTGAKLPRTMTYNITNDSYTEIGTMTRTKNRPAVSVVQSSDFSAWCQ